MSGIGLTPMTATRLKQVLRLKRLGIPDESQPRGGASTRSTVIARCLSATAAADTGVGSECYDAVLIDPQADLPAGASSSLASVWLSVFGSDGSPGVPATKGYYEGQLLGEVEAATGDKRPRVVAALGGSGGSGPGVPLVHVLGGDTYPQDPADWFCREVEPDGVGGWSEIFPFVDYGRGLVDGDGTGWVFEGSGLPPRVVDLDGGLVTHAIPIFLAAGKPDLDGPNYVIEWPNWDSTASLEVVTATAVSQNPTTCAYTVSETLTSYDWRVAFRGTTALTITISPTPP